MIDVNAALIQKVADLARLDLSEDEIREYVNSIGGILQHVDQLNTLDTDGVEPMYYGVDAPLRLREDLVQPLDPQSDGKPRILESAPEVLHDGFKVPPMIG
jgi:aspartyl-tRNA(Asn)/glutamyl-tRNA(Gln) amidotransferase subunit C